MRGIGITDFLERQFDTLPFNGRWADTFGEPERNFRMIVYGKPGNGKTEFAIQFAKYLSQFKKVYYNSFEQGISKTLQDALKRNKMQEVAGKVIFGDKENFEEMMERLGGKNAPQIVFIDSRDYINLTHQQYKEMTEAHPRKAFIIICWESGGKPKGEHAKPSNLWWTSKYSFTSSSRSRALGLGATKNSLFGIKRRRGDNKVCFENYEEILLAY